MVEAKTTKYRWVFDGDETYAASTSNVLGIKAMRDFNASYADRDGYFGRAAKTDG